MADEASNNLLDITKVKLMKSEQKNKELEEEIKGLEKELSQVKKELKKYTDKEASEKMVIEMHLKRIEQANKAQEKEQDGGAEA